MAHEFERLGWGPVSSGSQDLGIDLFVHARLKRHDRGLVVGVQVKSGKSCFNRPKTGQDGETLGVVASRRGQEALRLLGHARSADLACPPQSRFG